LGHTHITTTHVLWDCKKRALQTGMRIYYQQPEVSKGSIGCNLTVHGHRDVYRDLWNNVAQQKKNLNHL